MGRSTAFFCYSAGKHLLFRAMTRSFSLSSLRDATMLGINGWGVKGIQQGNFHA